MESLISVSRLLFLQVKINLIDVPRLTGEQVEKFTSDFQIIADYFVQLSKNNDYVPKDKIIRHTDSFLKLMSVLTQDNKYVEMGRKISHEMEGFNMCMEPVFRCQPESPACQKAEARRASGYCCP